jgi:hypothetical protein
LRFLFGSAVCVLIAIAIANCPLVLQLLSIDLIAGIVQLRI